MLQYTFKRLLLIPPTFFFVCLIIFFVLNLAPGRPGESQSPDQESRGDSIDESYRVFREQFSLDKPILLNLRPWIDTVQVREWLLVGAGTASTSLADRILALDTMDDVANDLVPHLMSLLDDPDAQVRYLAADRLSRAARLPLPSDAYAQSEAQKIQTFNDAFSDWRWDKQASPVATQEVIESWQAWYKINGHKYKNDTGQSLSRLFLDTRFARYLSNVARFDFGLSTVDRQPVFPVIVSKLRYSLSLTVVSIILAYLIAVPIGIFSATFQNTRTDTVVTLVLFVLYSLPTFFTGTVLLQLLTEGNPVAWFPTGGYASLDGTPRTTLEQIWDIIWHLTLPIATYTSVTLAALSRYARSGIVDVIRSDYVRTARAKGLSEFVVIVKHAARNGMIPILTLLGSLLPALVSGSVVIEVVFGIPGMGLYLFDAINLRDYNAVMAVLLAATLLTLIGILISDLSYAFADPRISLD